MILDSTIGLIMIPVLYVAVQRTREKFSRKKPDAPISKETAQSQV
jgi:hypothetical protein